MEQPHPQDDTSYLVISYYHFCPIDDPNLEVHEHKQYVTTLNGRGRIYVSNQGINGQVSLEKEKAHAYMQWLSVRKPFEKMEYKTQPHHSHAFAKLTVKYRSELVALGCAVDMTKTGKYLTPTQWKELLESTADKVILDVRNDYEWKLGHFVGAEVWPCQTFKEFKERVAELKKRLTPETKVLMYCTGGIRCELFSSLLIDEGIDNVFQLHGGIINYGVHEKSQHWLGKLFVFDDRLSVPISDEEAPVIATCLHCKKPCEVYYNCANMDCNELFISCRECLISMKGCCQESCMHAPRLRPYKLSSIPFRKWYHYAKTKADLLRIAKTEEIHV